MERNTVEKAIQTEIDTRTEYKKRSEQLKQKGRGGMNIWPNAINFFTTTAQSIFTCAQCDI